MFFSHDLCNTIFHVFEQGHHHNISELRFPFASGRYLKFKHSIVHLAHGLFACVQKGTSQGALIVTLVIFFYEGEETDEGDILFCVVIFNG